MDEAEGEGTDLPVLLNRFRSYRLEIHRGGAERAVAINPAHTQLRHRKSERPFRSFRHWEVSAPIQTTTVINIQGSLHLVDDKICC